MGVDEKKELSQSFSQVTPKKRSLPRVLIVFVVAMLLIVAGATVVSRYSSSSALCSEDVIQQYNTAATTTHEDNAYGIAIKDVANKVEAKSDFSKDATCTFIVFQHYAHIEDAQKSRDLLERMKELHKEDSTVSEDIVDYRSIEFMESVVVGIEHNQKLGDKLDGAG